MSPVGFGWRTAVLTVAALSAVVAVAGLVATQFDSQYDADSFVERIGAGLLAGMFAALVFLPVTLVAAGLVGVIAGVRHRRRQSGA